MYSRLINISLYLFIHLSTINLDSGVDKSVTLEIVVSFAMLLESTRELLVAIHRGRTGLNSPVVP
jgi:hypothetical protein